MHATLIYNQQAGNNSQPGPEQLLEALRQVGFEPAYHPTESEEDLNHVLDQARDLVVVAGGDGSVRAVATRLLGKDVRIIPLPMGTANNIARTLGLTGSPMEIIAGLVELVERDLDIGCVETPQGKYYFLEAMGIGMWADGMKKYQPENGKSLVRSAQSAVETLREYQPKFFHFSLDGDDLSGSYLMFEVMNTPSMGFRYTVAPNALPDDGLFDVVLIHASQRESYLRFAVGVLTKNLEKDPVVSVKRGSQLKIAWRGFPVHIDGEVLAGLDWKEAEAGAKEESKLLDVAGPFLYVELMPRAVHFLVPRAIGT